MENASLKGVDKRLLSIERMLKSRGDKAVGFPPLSDDQNDPAWVAQAEAWCIRNMGKTWEQAAKEAEEWVNETFPDLD